MKKTTALLAATLAVAASLTGGAAFAEGKKWTKVVIATEGAFPPYNLTRPDGTLDGYEVELSRDLCARMKVECTLVTQAFDGTIPALIAGKFDAVMSGMSVTEKRKEVIAFSVSYGGVGQAFGVEKGSDLEKMPRNGETIYYPDNGDTADYQKSVDSLKPFLKGKTVGVQSASIAARFLNQYYKDVITIREYKTTDQHDLDLAAGRVDAVMASMGYLTAAMKKPGNSEMIMVGPRFQGGPIIGAGSSVGLRKEDVELKAMFDEAIRAAVADGTVKRLSEKWFGFDVSPKL